jgi:REP element-mobilizing transposase RayT
MRKTLLAVYVHLVWGTWDRLPLLTEEIEAQVHRAIGAKAVELGAAPVAIGGTDDHVHLLVRLPATLAIADLVQGVKGASAHLVNHQLTPGGAFKWQGAYAVFSVSPRHRAQITDYIARQREHHEANAAAVEWEEAFLRPPSQPA